MSHREEWVSYFDNTFEYNIFEKVSWLNLKYDRIQNFVPIKPAYKNYGCWRDCFLVDPKRETWDTGIFGMTKRCWMKRCLEIEWYEITDVRKLRGRKYFFAVAKDKQTMQIREQDCSYGDCTKISPKWCCCPAMKMVACLPFNKCTHDRFAPVVAPMDETGFYNDACIKHKYVWGQVVAFVTDANGKPLKSNPGEYVLIQWVSWPKSAIIQGICWQYRQIVRQGDESIGWGSIVDFPFYGMVDNINSYVDGDGNFTNIRWDGSTIDSEIETCWVRIKTYSKVGETLAYASADGIFYLSESDPKECSCEPNTENPPDCNSTTFCQTFCVDYPIKAMASFCDGRLAFVTGWQLFWGQWGNNFGNFSRSNAVWDDVFDLMPVQDYLLIIWPENVKIWYIGEYDVNGTGIPTVTCLVEDFWAWSKCSYSTYFYEHSHQFIMYDSRWELRKYDIIPTDHWNGRVSFRIDAIPIGQRFIHSDIANLDRKYDRLAISDRGRWFRIFIWREDREAPTDTKIIFFCEKYKYYYRWYICGLKIKFERYNCRVGDRVYSNEWDTDGWYIDPETKELVPGSPVKQYISFTFGDTSINKYKKIYSLSIPFYASTKISQETVLKTAIQVWGYWLHTEFTERRSSRYITNVQHALTLALSVKKDECVMFDQTELGVGVYTGHWVWVSGTKWLDHYNDMKWFCALGEGKPHSKLPCDLRGGLPYKKKDPESCKLEHEPCAPDNHADAYMKHANVAQVETVQYRINQPWRLFQFELVWWANDKICFQWFEVGRKFMDPETQIPENVLRNNINVRKHYKPRNYKK